MEKYMMALDQGTTSSRCILFDRKGNICSVAQKEFEQHYPKPGWVEHDPMEIWASQVSVLSEAMNKIAALPEQIHAIGITNQRETTIIWDKKTGRPIYPAIVWQCRRTSERIDRLRADGMTQKVREKTGLVPDAYFSATKIEWILDQVPGARKRAQEGELLFGTVDCWLVWKLTSVLSMQQITQMHQEQCCLTFIRWSGIRNFWNTLIFRSLCFQRFFQVAAFTEKQIQRSQAVLFRLRELRETSRQHFLVSAVLSLVM